MAYDVNGNYVTLPRVERESQYLGELPSNGAWKMHVIPLSAQKDVVILVDTSGKNHPRSIRAGKLTILGEVE